MLIAFAGVTALPKPALAAPPASRLVYARGEGAAECPDESAFRKAVAGRIGYDPFFPWAEVSVTAEIRAEGSRLLGRVALVDPTGMVRGTRELVVKHGDCAELLTSMALAVSIALDALEADPPPSASAARRAPTPAEGEGSASIEAPADAPLPSVAAPSSPSRPAGADPDKQRTAPPESSAGIQLRDVTARAFVGIAAVLAAGSSPGITPGAALSIGVERGRFALGIEGRDDAASSAAGPAGTAVRGHFLSISVLPCAQPAWVFFVCAAASVDRLNGQGVGVPAPKSDDAWFVALGARGGVSVPLGRVIRGQVYGDLRLPAGAPSLGLQQSNVWGVAAVYASLGLGASVHFP